VTIDLSLFIEHAVAEQRCNPAPAYRALRVRLMTFPVCVNDASSEPFNIPGDHAFASPDTTGESDNEHDLL
jgi:hypothetical protein